MVTPYYPPHIGGLELYVMKLSEYLIKRGIEVEVFTSQIPSGNYSSSKPIRVHRFKPIATPLKNPITLGMIFKINYMQQFDIIHAHVDQAFSTNIAILSKKYHKRPVIVHCHGLYYPESILGNIAYSVYYRTIGKWCIKKAEAIITLSKRDYDFMIQLGARQKYVRIIPNAIDPIDYRTETKVEDFLRQYGIEDKRVILYVGALIVRKGVHVLLKALPNVFEEFRNAILLVIGEGDQKISLINMAKSLGIADRTLFLGTVDRETLFKAFKAAEIVVLPSFLEGMPTVILEALVFGKPVVATSIPGVVDYFRNATILVPPGNPMELSKAIRILLNDRLLREKLASKGKELVNKFTFGSIANRIIDLYEELTHKN